MRGRRCHHGSVVVHLGRADDDQVRIGLAVSKIVGNAVTRHAVARKLRHVMAPRVQRLPDGSRVVVRALAAAAHADSAALSRDIDAALNTLLANEVIAR